MSSFISVDMDSGDLESFVGTVTDDVGTPIDIQGADMEFGCKKYVDDVDYVFLKTTADGSVTILDDGTDANRGTYQVLVAPADLTGHKSGFYHYSLRISFGSSDTHTLVRGSLLLRTSVVPS